MTETRLPPTESTSASVEPATRRPERRSCHRNVHRPLRNERRCLRITRWCMWYASRPRGTCATGCATAVDVAGTYRGVYRTLTDASGTTVAARVTPDAARGLVDAARGTSNASCETRMHSRGTATHWSGTAIPARGPFVAACGTTDAIRGTTARQCETAAAACATPVAIGGTTNVVRGTTEGPMRAVPTLTRDTAPAAGLQAESRGTGHPGVSTAAHSRATPRASCGIAGRSCVRLAGPLGPDRELGGTAVNSRVRRLRDLGSLYSILVKKAPIPELTIKIPEMRTLLTAIIRAPMNIGVSLFTEIHDFARTQSGKTDFRLDY